MVAIDGNHCEMIQRCRRLVQADAIIEANKKADVFIILVLPQSLLNASAFNKQTKLFRNLVGLRRRLHSLSAEPETSVRDST